MADRELMDLFKKFAGDDDPTGTLAVLIHETVKLRDALKKDTGRILTVGDTGVALEALKEWLSGQVPSVELSEDQASLLKAWQTRLLH